MVKIMIKKIAWLALSAIAAISFGFVVGVFNPGERVNALWLVTCTACVYAISYRFYSAFIAARVLAIDKSKPTPAERLNDGTDYYPTNKWVLFGHHFAAIAGAGPLIGPMLAAQFGYLPGFLWILIGAAVAIAVPQGISSLANKGPHGLSEILYAFSSAAGNNGSAFAGLGVNTPFYNIALGVSMLIGRFAVIIPSLAVAGSLAKKKTTPFSSGTFPTDGPLFIALLISVIFIVGALTFFPALALGPVTEHFLMLQGRTF